jgi:hypothetical protein
MHNVYIINLFSEITESCLAQCKFTFLPPLKHGFDTLRRMKLYFITLVTRAVNDIILAIYPIHSALDKTNMGNILFSLSYRVWVWVWVWVRKKIINLSGMDMGKEFLLPIIHWVNYINTYIVKYI